LQQSIGSNCCGYSDVLRLLRLELNEGEAETIGLALQEGASLVLLDQTDARRVADVPQLPKTGVVGILIRAKLEGKIPTP
jgi:predicted nucleic acid-binding protein